MSVLVVAEKPSVARDIAYVLGARDRADGYLRGGGWIVTWAIGHLVALAEPHEMNPAWKRWRLADLPLLPSTWPLVVSDETREQYGVVRRLLVESAVRGVVCATDAGREGELIFRYIYEASGSSKPIKRLWISSLTPEAIEQGFRALRDGRSFDRLADAARARSRADWLVGMNLSRLYSVLHDDNLSVGRVQTPTLAMIVERELEIRAFVPEDYLEVVATFAPPPDGPGARGSSQRADGAAGEATSETYEGAYVGPGGDDEKGRPRQPKRLAPSGEEASGIVDRARRGRARIQTVDRQTRRVPPPQLYDLTELQRHANRLYGFTAERTLKLAQKLYEERKLLSYPRTDSRYLSRTIERTLPSVVQAIEGAYRGSIAAGTGARPLGGRFVDDARVSDHHAILPTEKKAPEDLPADERKIYDLVCRRLLSAWHADHVFAVTTVITTVTLGDVTDRYLSSGTSVESEGWKVLDVRLSKAADRGHRAGGRSGAESPGARAPRGAHEPQATLPGGLRPGLSPRIVGAKAVPKQTRPPPRLTDATLLTAMETAGRNLASRTEGGTVEAASTEGRGASGAHGLDETEISQAMRERGLGTPATRASMIETLLRREYIARDGKVFQATDKGVALIARVHPHVKSPAMTGEWEARLARIERGDESLEGFMQAIERYVREVVGSAVSGAEGDVPAPRSASSAAAGDVQAPWSASSAPAGGVQAPRSVAPRPGPSREAQAPARSAAASTTEDRPRVLGSPTLPSPPTLPSRPRARSTDLGELLASAFGFSSFRPYQEAVCRAAASGKDVLLVMPTGAGKSLCYQLPGVARGGTTLVVSPLIALMEDQVAQLTRRGFAAERIHSGRGRGDARAVCRAYLEGGLDFLFIAPERLRVPGFPEMLARRKPTLVAIDEAHCISHWGHDFRPDYRMLRDRLRLLRPSPVIALTATATPAVQEDIVAELRLESPARFIHGFRRTNIGVEVVERSPGDRADVVRAILKDPERRPAIVYAPTRSESEQLAAGLAPELRAAAYHAGLTSRVREDVQSAFLGGGLDVIIATTAFGMGIDKSDVRTVLHTALPASIEGYYQEIGRAGRDGEPSRAILIHSFVDTKTHEFFLERDYPEAAVLARVQRSISAEGSSMADLARRARTEPEIVEKAIDKLWVHGGALVDPDGTVRPGGGDWRRPYEVQRAYKREQLDKMRRYAETSACRMLLLVSHFGDQNDAGTPCGLCDVCAPDSSVALSFRAASPAEQSAAARILSALRERDGRSVGQIHREVFADGALDRRSLDHVLGALVRAGAVRVVADAFEKDGATIAFQRVWLANGAGGAPLRVVDTPPPSAKKRKGKTAKGRAKRGATRGEALREAPRSTRPARAAASEAASTLDATLRAWRSSEAKRRGIPAFRILTDRTIAGIAEARPTSEAQLLAVPGMGMALLEKYGRQLLAIVARG